ncbi:MAG: UvrD-helicase domain-containing protein, partial [Clostridia bacterium]|nr:UvrD-helicase domain-containing protein [Clostridia bacterium]
SRYKYVYVDEYQDVSGIQDAIIKSLSGEGHRLFMVGDIKQSIYGFRHAEPELFEHERRTYSDDPDAAQRRIFFMDNYRSCMSVVRAVNAVFTEAMDRQVTDMDYLEYDNLRCNLEGDFGPVDVVLVKKGEDDTDKIEAQSHIVGRYIRSLISPAAESDKGSVARYGDIVILLSTATNIAPKIAEHLKDMGIPAVYEGAGDFYGLSEVKAFLSLLTAIDNLHNDDALVGALINPPFSFNDRELAEIRLAKPENVPFYEAFERCCERNDTEVDKRCVQALRQLEAWKALSEEMTVPEFVWRLMRETGLYASRGAYPDGKARQLNLDSIYRRALDGQAAGQMRLSDFISELRGDKQTGARDDDPPSSGPDDNFVRIMTMHKSKGLEFPCVILMNLQKSIHQKRTESKLRMNVSSGEGALGLYLPLVERRKNTTRDSQGKEAFNARAHRQNISEDTRLLYVAMTRAQKRLCLVASVKDGDEALWSMRDRTLRIWKTRSMLDMIMPAVLRELSLPEVGKCFKNDLWRLSVDSAQAIEQGEEAPFEFASELDKTLSSEEDMFMYTASPEKRFPLKTSVTTLTREMALLSDEDSEETVDDKRLPEESVRTFRLSPEPERPAFMEEDKVEASSIGTATHRFLRLIDLQAFKNESGDIRRVQEILHHEMQRLRDLDIVSAEEAQIIRLYDVAAFLSSPLGRRMLASALVKREACFTMRISPDSPTTVQGIVDCAFMEDGKWVLIDYKTDRDTAPETFVPRHEAQMNWYAEALRRLTGTPVKEMWLFALRADRAYRVEERDVSVRL